MVVAVASAANWSCGSSSTCSVAWLSNAKLAPLCTWLRSVLSALLSRPWAIDWTRKKPSTAMTRADSTSVVETTRSCSERCQRLRSCATIRRCQRRPVNRPCWIRPGSLRMTALPYGDRTKTVIQSCCLSLPAAATVNDPDLARTRLVTDTAYRHDDLGMLRVLLDLGPQPLHVHVDQPGVGRMPVAPDLLEQPLPGEDLPGFAGQRHEQVKLQRGEVEGLAVALHRVAGHVDDSCAGLEHPGGRCVAPSAPDYRPSNTAVVTVLAVSMTIGRPDSARI